MDEVTLGGAHANAQTPIRLASLDLAMAISLFDLDAFASPHASWTLLVLLVSASAALYLSRRTSALEGDAAKSNIGAAPVCPPELLKDNLGGSRSGSAVVNAYAADVEMDVPFDIGEVRVSNILVHPIKVRKSVAVAEP